MRAFGDLLAALGYRPPVTADARELAMLAQQAIDQLTTDALSS